MRRTRSTTLVFGLAGLILLGLPHRSAAVILPARTLDGPSQEIVGTGGVAMAEDGTGGVVYLKRVGGVPHVFVARFIAGHWLAPIRVDTGEQFAASWPRIGAANDGELIVVWATPFATEEEEPVDELVAATLGPASSSFGPPIIVDPNIQDATGTSPDLAVSSTGQADVVYRVVNRAGSGEIPPLRPGDVVEQVRLAHYNGQRWTSLGAINREPGLSMRPPTELNAPKLAIGPTGNGVVVWQEPEISGLARIWARRLFGTSLDYVLPVSTESFGGAPLVSDADAPSAAISTLGQGIIAYRQSSGPASPLSASRIFLNTLPDGESQSGAQFLGAILADSAVSTAAGAGVGPPSVDLDEQRETRLLYDAGGVARVVEGNDQGLLTSTAALGPSFAGAEQAAVSVMNPEGGGVSAWPSADAAGHPAVAVREDFPSGAVQTGLVGGGAGGEVSELSVGRSGLGDGLVAFRQGPLGNAAIVAGEATAPPAQFRLNVPKGWIAPSRAIVSWDQAASANGPLSYEVLLDGHPLRTPRGARSLKLDPRLLGDGRHGVQVLASDIDGQATLSAPVALKIDGRPPSVTIARVAAGRGVSIRVSDRYSGVETHAVRVSFGDGHHAGKRARLRHRYARAGIYEVVVSVRNKLGFKTTVRQLVSVR